MHQRTQPFPLSVSQLFADNYSGPDAFGNGKSIVSHVGGSAGLHLSANTPLSGRGTRQSLNDGSSSDNSSTFLTPSSSTSRRVARVQRSLTGNGQMTSAPPESFRPHSTSDSLPSTLPPELPAMQALQSRSPLSSLPFSHLLPPFLLFR